MVEDVATGVEIYLTDETLKSTSSSNRWWLQVANIFYFYPWGDD